MLQHNTPDQFSRRQMLRNSALLAGGALAAGLPLSSAANAQDTVANWPAVTRMINDYVGSRKVANMVAGMGWGQAPAEYIRRGNTSFTSDTRVGLNTLYRIYSMTKPITGMAAMMCIDDGLMALDQPLSEIIPAFANLWVQKQYDGAVSAGNLERLARPITIRHLLTHTAGLGYSVVQKGPIARAYNDRGLVPGQITRLSIPGIIDATPLRSLESFADELAKVPLVYQPGTKWSYSVSLDLLGRVIEVVTGKKFDAFLQERIFTPCGMDSTWFRVPASEKGRFTANYFLLGEMLLPIDMPDSSVYLDQPAFPFGGAGLVSSSRDYDRFLMMLAGRGEIGGVRVMSQAAVAMGTSDLFPDTLVAGGGFSANGTQFGFGAGGLVGKGMAAGLYGWFGAAGTVGLVNTNFGLRHNLMTQYMPAESYEVQTQFPLAVAADAVAFMQRG